MLAQLVTIAEGLAAEELSPEADGQAVLAYVSRPDIAGLIEERARDTAGM